ncbi:MAG: hypothetical protein K5787_06675 [Lentisphaeria bacterium]|nr:hypothetical protein [Lentisphaeria bacterium]
MKQLFRRIFFWDESAKGAHFGLTLFFVVPWIILSILYLVFCPLFFHAQQKNPALWLMMVVSGIGVLSLIYSVFLLIHILIVNSHGLLKKLPWGMLIQGVVLLITGIYLYKFVIFKIFGTLGLISNAFPTGQPLNTTKLNFLVSGNNIIIAIVLIVALLATGYVCLGKTIAGIGQVPYSQLWTKGVKTLWMLFIAIYILSWAMGLYAVHASRNAVAELERSLGKPVTPEALAEIYYHGQQPDADFWKKLKETEPSALLNPEEEQEEKTITDEDSDTESAEDEPEKDKKISWNTIYMTMDGLAFAEAIPQEIIDRWKKDFLDKPETKTWEALFDQPLPPNARDYSASGILDGMMFSELSFGRALCRYENSRIRIALDSKDFSAVEAALARMRNASGYYEHDTFLVGGLVWVSCEALQMNALAHIIDSAQPSDEWLRQLDRWLESRERIVESVLWNSFYGEAVTGLNMFKAMEKGIHVTDTMSCTPINLNLLNWLMPQTMFFFGLETAGLADLYRTGIEKGYRQTRPHGMFASMLQPTMEKVEKKYKAIIAEYRIMRGVVAAELHRRQHGSFPLTMKLLEDPLASGQLLKYQCGKVDITQSVWNAEKQKCEPQQRKIHGMKIWTLGLNGMDDGGLYNLSDNQDDRCYWLRDK